MINRAKLTLSLILIFVICSAFIARLYAAGWLLVPMGLIYLTAALLHWRFHYRLAKSATPPSQLTLLAIVLSHLCFIAAFLFQYDYGDGPGWLTITILFRGMAEDPIEGTLWHKHVLLMNLLVFIPVLVSWYPLKPEKKSDLAVSPASIKYEEASLD
jgi:hypothetical protein